MEMSKAKRQNANPKTLNWDRLVVVVTEIKKAVNPKILNWSL